MTAYDSLVERGLRPQGHYEKAAEITANPAGPGTG